MAVLGAGESGVGAALLAARKGFEVFVSDGGNIREPWLQELQTAGIEYEQGGHTAQRLLEADEVVKSPGIPDTAPIVELLKKAGKPVISEIEFAARFTRATIVGITGSNGKTTTTLLTHHLLVRAGVDAMLGGNVGKSFARNVAEREPAVHVLELSSFQLDGIVRFRPHVAILLNITPDHLDRYGYRIENYVASKFRIAMNQGPEDLLILNADDPLINDWRRRHGFPAENGPRLLEVSTQFASTDFLEIGDLTFDMRQTALKGPHNFFNACCAILAALNLGAEAEAIQQGLQTFVNAPHRMQLVAEFGGVRWINDSKATNVDAVRRALETMDRPVVWIAGGTDKGNDYSVLLPLVRRKVKALVCLGVDNHRLAEAFASEVPRLIETRSAKQAVEAASQLAQPGDVVLLSPACASFDLFKNYEDRGDQFSAAVLELKRTFEQTQRS